LFDSETTSTDSLGVSGVLTFFDAGKRRSPEGTATKPIAAPLLPPAIPPIRAASLHRPHFPAVFTFAFALISNC